MTLRANTIVSGGLLTQQVMAFLLNVIVARSLGAVNFGELGILKNLSTFVLVLTPLGLDLALLKHGSLYREKPIEFRLLSITLRLLAAGTNLFIVVSVAVWIGPWLQLVYPSQSFSYLSTITMVGIVFAADLQISGALFRVDGQLVEFSLVVMYLQSVVRLVFSVLAIYLGGGILSVVWVNTITFILIAIFNEFFSKGRSVPLRFSGRVVLQRQISLILSESIWMALSLLTYQAMRFVDVIVLGALTTVSQTGEYSALSSICQIIQIYPAAISQMLGPTIAILYKEGRLQDICMELKRYVRTASLVGGFMFAGIAVFGSSLDLLFGHGFVFAWQLSLTLSTGWYVSATLAPFGYVLSMTGRHRGEMFILLGGAILLVVLLYALIPLLASLGAAVSVLSAFAVVNIVRCIYVIRIIGCNPLQLESLAPPALFLTLAALSHITMSNIGERTLVWLIAECILYTLLAATAFIVLFAHKTEVRWFRAKITAMGTQR